MHLAYHIMEAWGDDVLENKEAIAWLNIETDEMITSHLVSDSASELDRTTEQLTNVVSVPVF